MEYATLLNMDRQGRIVIPIQVRKALKLEEGDLLALEANEKNILLRKQTAFQSNPNISYTATRKKRGSASGNTARKKVQEPLYISEPVYQEPCYDEFNPEFLSEDSEDNFPDSEMVPLDKKSIMS